MKQDRMPVCWWSRSISVIPELVALVPTLRAGNTMAWEQSFKHLHHSCLTACTFNLHETYRVSKLR